MYIIICGDRHWDHEYPIEEFIRTLNRSVVIVHGNANGADKMAGRIAKKYGHEVIAVPAEWDRYGRGAGPVRNRKMADEHEPELVVGYHDNISESKGTRDMILKVANKENIPWVLFTSNGSFKTNIVYGTKLISNDRWFIKITEISERIKKIHEHRLQRIKELVEMTRGLEK